MTVIVSNEPRGCGTKKKGGYYLTTAADQDGLLASAWWLGSHLEGGENFYATRVPSRGVWIWNPAVSLVTGELVTEPGDFAAHHIDATDENMDVLWRVGGYPALIDYVGAGNYTPRTFADEVFRHGPSRKVTFETARVIAAHLPVPIFFVAELPIFTADERPAFLARVAAHAETDAAREYDARYKTHEDGDALVEPLWRTNGWGMTRFDRRGHGHYMARAIRWGLLDDIDDYPVTARLPFFASWITQSVWIAPTLDDALSPPPAVAAAGIEVGVLENTPEAAAVISMQHAPMGA